MCKFFWKCFAIICTLNLIFMIGGMSVQAQSVDVIRDIIVEGNERIETQTVESYLPIRPGDNFNREAIDLSLKTLFATGLFADVLIERRGQDLIVRLVENPIINQVLLEGNKAISEDKILEEVLAEPRGIFTSARVQADVQRILEVYRRAGRFAAQVTPYYEPLEQNRVDLVFEIVEGPVTGVKSINFIGNKAFSDRRLRGEIATQQSRWWRFFSSRDHYDPDQLEYDREQLRKFYANQGYVNFRVISAVADLTPDQQDFYITFTIDEGEKFNFGEIKVETALSKLNGDALRRAVPIENGEQYKGDLIEDSIDALTFAAGISGYAFVDVRPLTEQNPENNTVDVIFALDEGPRVYIERINIVGNTRTLDHVIRRELRLLEGDAFNRVLLDQSRLRVRALRYFGEVEVIEKPGSAPDRTIIDVEVEEQPTGQFAFSFGYSSSEAFLLDLSVTEQNLRGRGQSVQARIANSARYSNIGFQFTEPRFLNRNLAAGFDLFASETDYADIGSFVSETLGFGFRLGAPLTDRSQLGLRYSLRNDNINVTNRDIEINAEGQFVSFVFLESHTLDNADNIIVDQCDVRYIRRSSICSQETEDITSVLGYSVSWDTRNDPIMPTRGYRLTLSQDFAGLGGDVKYLKHEFNGSIYRGLYPGFIASARLSAGWIDGYDEDSIRINNRFFKGGSSFRGFEIAGMGPRQLTSVLQEDGSTELFATNALGGKLYGIGTFELTIPTGLSEDYGIEAALFAQVGTLGKLDPEDKIQTTYDSISGLKSVVYVDDAASLRASVGLSVFWDSPFGPVQFDFSDVVRREWYDNTETFRFSTRTRF